MAHWDDDIDDEVEDDDDDLDFDCGWTPDLGGCTLAGSEDCDWDCPYRDEMEAQLNPEGTTKR